MKPTLLCYGLALLLLIANLTSSQIAQIVSLNGAGSFNIISSNIITVFDPNLIIASDGTTSRSAVQKTGIYSTVDAFDNRATISIYSCTTSTTQVSICPSALLHSCNRPIVPK